MTWQIVIILQVIVSALMTIFTRRMALTDRKLFFVIGSLSYLSVAVMGTMFSLLFGGQLPEIPNGRVWIYLIAEGIFIPASWLLQYRIISRFGASNAVLITMLNYVGTALMGFTLLNESFSFNFLIGALFILSSIFIAFRVQPDSVHHESISLVTKSLLVSAMVVFFSLGMFAEKQAIDIAGVWNYACFGWGMQFIGSLVLMTLYGRHELTHITSRGVKNGLLLGFITSLAGGLFIYALSIGTLSHTIIGASGKIALTMFLAALLLKERNALPLRVLAFALSTAGLLFLVV